MDTDGDRKVTLDEFKKWFKAHQKGKLNKKVFPSEDKNGDKVIEWWEFSGPKGEGTEKERSEAETKHREWAIKEKAAQERVQKPGQKADPDMGPKIDF